MSESKQAFEAFRQESHQFLYEMDSPGRIGMNFPELEVPESTLPPSELLRDELPLPSLGEQEVERYYKKLGDRNHCIADSMYPLGSCTMKLNPKINDVIVGLPGFANTHPDQAPEQVQGNLELMHDLQRDLAEITGMDAVSLAPQAGAQGEFAGILIIRKFHEDNEELEDRRRILVAKSAHGTNPSTAAMGGFSVHEIPEDENANINLELLAAELEKGDVAGMMFTQPSTQGLYDPNMPEICDMVHEAGGLVYCDGANLNAIAGRVRPGDQGADIMHSNLHKTFSTPHGGGGPGAGPVCVKDFLADYLPGPVIKQNHNGEYVPVRPSQSIGILGEGYGNFGVLVMASAYIRSLGSAGIREMSQKAVLNASYVKACLQDVLPVAYDRQNMHEYIATAKDLKAQTGVSAMDIAKGLIEAGFHPPTMYFPKFVPEALMIEPTESETKQSMDRFVDAVKLIVKTAVEDPEFLINAPYRTPVRRVDETYASRNLVLRWQES